MSDSAIKVVNLGKKYVLAHQQARGHKNYVALRDVLVQKAMAPLRWLARKGQPSTSATREDFWALKDVSFEIPRGQVVGIIGRNGAGKSTLLKLLSRITEPTTGRIEMDGRTSSLLEVGTGFHPELTGRENIYLNGAILGMERTEIKRKFDEIVAFAEVEKFLDTPVKRYSSGMYVRLAFAVAAHLEPDILIVDEVLSVGDAQFQKKCIGRMQAASEHEGRTVLFVSHNLQTIRQMCERVVLLKKGAVEFIGDPHTGINGYLNQSAEEYSAAIDLDTYPRRHDVDGARLLTLRFLNENGTPASKVPWRSDLLVQFTFRIDRPVKRLDISMDVIHPEGLPLFSEIYSDQHEPESLEPGEYSAQFSVPLRFLKLESYFLNVTVSEDLKVWDHISGLPMPEMIDEEADPHVEGRRWGVVRVPVRWDSIEKAGQRELAAAPQ